MRGIFISFEGGDGCGKSTQIALLAERLRTAGRRLLLTREPGGTALGESIRHLLQNAKEGAGMEPETELLLFAASRAELVRKVIAPALAEGVTVLADRFLDSTTVYQGVNTRLQPSDVRAMNEFVLDGLRPDLTLLLDLPPERARERLHARLPSGTAPDRIESRPAAFHDAVRNGYLTLAREEPGRIRVIDASGSPESVARTLHTLLENEFHGFFTRSGV